MPVAASTAPKKTSEQAREREKNNVKALMDKLCLLFSLAHSQMRSLVVVKFKE
jgi:hypothetical protein